MSEAAKKSPNDGFLMMKGTEGYMNYAVIARRGPVTLSISPKGFGPGPWGTNTTLFSFKVRAQDNAEKVFSHEDKVNNVVALGDNNISPKEAFDFPWEQKHISYASVGMVFTLKGGLNANAETLLLLKDGAAARTISKALTSNINPAHMIITEDRLAEFFQGHFQAVIERIEEQIAMQKAAEDVQNEWVGTVQNYSSLLKTVKDKLPSKSAPHDTDVDDIETDEDADDE